MDEGSVVYFGPWNAHAQVCVGGGACAAALHVCVWVCVYVCQCVMRNHDARFAVSCLF